MLNNTIIITDLLFLCLSDLAVMNFGIQDLIVHIISDMSSLDFKVTVMTLLLLQE